MRRLRPNADYNAPMRAVTVVGALAIIMLVTPVVLVGMIPLVFVYAGMQMGYIKTSRELKRLQSIALSPIFSHLNESLQVSLLACRSIQCCVYHEPASSRLSDELLMVRRVHRTRVYSASEADGSVPVYDCLSAVVSTYD